MTRRPWLLLALGLGVLCAGPVAAGESLQESHVQLEAKAAKDIEAHAEWCIKKRLYGKRDEAYEALLTFDPLHAKARKKLRYTRGEDGAWVQHTKYRRPTKVDHGGCGERAQHIDNGHEERRHF